MKRKSNLLAVVVFECLLTAAIAAAGGPPVEWSKTFGGSYDDRGFSVQQTSSGEQFSPRLKWGHALSGYLGKRPRCGYYGDPHVSIALDAKGTPLSVLILSGSPCSLNKRVKHSLVFSNDIFLCPSQSSK